MKVKNNPPSAETQALSCCEQTKVLISSAVFVAVLVQLKDRLHGSVQPHSLRHHGSNVQGSTAAVAELPLAHVKAQIRSLQLARP